MTAPRPPPGSTQGTAAPSMPVRRNPSLAQMNITETIFQQAARTPDRDAFVHFGGRTRPYAELVRAVNVLALRLHDAGLTPGATAVIDTQGVYVYLVTALALARLGVVFAPPSLPTAWADLALAGPDAMRSDWPRALNLHALVADIVDAPPAAAEFPSAPGGDTPLMHCPCSGTTGAVKFVPLTHALATLRAQGRGPGLARVVAQGGLAAVRQACLIGPGSSYGFSSALALLASGGAVLGPNARNEPYAPWFARSGVNHMIASPFALRAMIAALPATRIANALEAIEVGGGALAPGLLAQVKARLCPQVDLNYGLTECGRVAGASADAVDHAPDAVGYPYEGVAVEIVDDADQPLPPGTRGILRVRSARSGSGYLRDPAASASVFRSGWVYPGDLGVLAPDGLLRIVGRLGDVVNRGGVKVALSELERGLLALGGIDDVAVFAHGGASDVRVWAAVVAATRLDLPAYHARVREVFGSKAPDVVFQPPALPRNANGKVAREDLARLANDALRADRPTGR